MKGRRRLVGKGERERSAGHPTFGTSTSRPTTVPLRSTTETSAHWVLIKGDTGLGPSGLTRDVVSVHLPVQMGCAYAKLELIRSFNGLLSPAPSRLSQS